MIGRTLGGYRIIEQIGMGGMATVYKAYDPNTERYVAIKTLPQQYSSDPTFRARFKREAKAIARLEHIHILPVHAYGEEDGIAYMVMRYMDTGTLSDMIRRGSLDLPTTGRLLTQIAGALDYAHSQGVIHRDIKPSNVLVDQQGNAFLTDFGIAKMVESTIDLTGTGILGTPQYMSPEQCSGQKELTPASDQYSLGVVVYEMVTGRTPFQAETPLAIIHMQLTEAPLPPPSSLHVDLPEAVEGVMLKALTREPERRYENCLAFARAFTTAVDASAATRPTMSAPTKPAKTQQHEPPTTPAGASIPSPLQDDQPTTVLRNTRGGMPAWIYGMIGVIAVVVIAAVIIATNSPAAGTTPTPEATTGAEIAAESTQAVIPTSPPTEVSAAQDTSSTIEALVADGDSKSSQDNWSGALDAYNSALALNPDDATRYNILASIGWVNTQQEDYDGAIQSLNAAVAIVDTDPSTYQMLGDAYQGQGDAEKAIEAYRSALALNPDPEMAHNMLVDIGWLDNDLGNYSDAVDSFNAAVALNDSDPEAYQMVGDAYQGLGNVDSALEAYQNAIARNPDVESIADIHNSIGWIQLDQGNNDAAVTSFSDAIDLVESNPDSYFGLGTAYGNTGDFENARNAYQRVITLDPGNFDAWMNAGHTSFALADYEQALQSFTHAAQLDSSSIQALIGIGDSQARMNDYDKALETYNNALALNPGRDDTAMIQVGIGWVHFAREEYDAALASFNSAVELVDWDPGIYTAIGEANDALGNPSAALDAFNQAIELNESSSYAHSRAGDMYAALGEAQLAIDQFNRAIELAHGTQESYGPTLSSAWMYLGVGDFQTAIDRFNQAIQVDNRDGSTYLGLAQAYQGAENRDAAVDAFNQALQWVNDDDSRYIAHLELGRLYTIQGNYDAAMDHLHQAEALNSGDASLYQTLGDAHAGMGHLEDALSAYSRATELDPQSAIAYLGKANVLYTMENYAEALDNYRHYVELAGDEVDPGAIQRIHELEGQIGSSEHPILILGSHGGVLLAMPSTGSEEVVRLGGIAQLTPLGRLDDSSYFLVESDGQIGWIHRAFVNEIQGNADLIPVIPTAILGPPGAVLRAAPSSNAEQTARIPGNSRVIITGRTEDGRYFLVEYRGETGWLYYSMAASVEGDIDVVPVVQP